MKREGVRNTIWLKVNSPVLCMYLHMQQIVQANNVNGEPGRCTVFAAQSPLGMFSAGILLTALFQSVFLRCSWWQRRLPSCTVLVASFWGQAPLLCL